MGRGRKEGRDSKGKGTETSTATALEMVFNK